MGDTRVAPSGASDGGAVGGAQGAAQSGQAGAGAAQAGAQGAQGAGMNKGGGAGGEGVVTEEELVKSMNRLEQIVQSAPEGRKQALLQKAMQNAISGEENAELLKILGGDTLDKSLSAGVGGALDPSGNETFAKSIDVSPYLDELHTRLSGGMLQVAEYIEKSDARHQEQVVVLAKGLLDLGKAISHVAAFQKGMAERMGIIDRQPARGPRALGAGGNTQPAPLEKSFAGARPQGEQLSKAEVSDLISEMLQESHASGRDGLSKSGTNILVESSQYEQFNQFSTPGFEAEVVAFAKAKRAARQNGHAR